MVFPNSFNDMSDPCQRGEIRYPLDEIPLLTRLAVLAGADSFVDIPRFGDKKVALGRLVSEGMACSRGMEACVLCFRSRRACLKVGGGQPGSPAGRPL